MRKGSTGVGIGVIVGVVVLIVLLAIPRDRPPVTGPGSVTGTAPNRPPEPQQLANGEAPKKVESPSEPLAQTSPKEVEVPAVARRSAQEPSSQTSPPPAAASLAPPIGGSAAKDVAREALDNLQFALRDHRSALGGNPVGNNQEITSALFGDNLKQVKQPMPQGSRINAKGELCDPWGTPYFFHQQSATKMEVRSAGPDLELWTGDDVQM